LKIKLNMKIDKHGGAIRPLPRDGAAEEFHRHLTVGPRPKFWTRDQKWKNLVQKMARRKGSDAG